MASAVELEKKPKLCKSLSEIKNKLNGFLVGIVDLLWRELQHEKPPKSSASLRFVTFLSHCCIWCCFYNAYLREKALLGKCLKIQMCQFRLQKTALFSWPKTDITSAFENGCCDVVDLMVFDITRLCVALWATGP